MGPGTAVTRFRGSGQPARAARLPPIAVSLLSLALAQSAARAEQDPSQSPSAPAPAPTASPAPATAGDTSATPTQQAAPEGKTASPPAEAPAPEGATTASAEPPPRREVPDYRGQASPAPTPGEVLIWVPRVILLSAYLVTNYVIRVPIGAAATAAEKEIGRASCRERV